MARGRWVELIFGAVLPTIFVIPFVVAMLWDGILTGEAVAYGLCVPAVLAMMALWGVLLVGPEAICRRPVLRWLTLMMLMLGIVVAACILAAYLRDGSIRRFGPAPWYLYVWGNPHFIALILIGPLIVGIRYVRMLFKLRSQGRSTDAGELQQGTHSAVRREG